MPFVQMIGPSALVGLHVTFDNRPINLGDRPIFELARQPLRRPNVSCKNDRAGNRPIESMRQPEVNVAFLLLTFTIERLHSNLHAIDAGGRLR